MYYSSRLTVRDTEEKFVEQMGGVMKSPYVGPFFMSPS